MTIIECAAASCRHNQDGQCGLTTIAVAPGTGSLLPAMIEDTAQLVHEDTYMGYLDEFAAYRDYAAQHPDHLMGCAICVSYSP